MLFITNKMPNLIGNGTVTMNHVDVATVTKALNSGFISLVDEAATALCLTNYLGVEVPIATLKIAPKIGEDSIIVVNINGVIEKSFTTIPAGVSVQFHTIESNKPLFDTKAVKRGIANWLLKD